MKKKKTKKSKKNKTKKTRSQRRIKKSKNRRKKSRKSKKKKTGNRTKIKFKISDIQIKKKKIYLFKKFNFQSVVDFILRPIFVAYENMHKYFNNKKVMFLGNPLRRFKKTKRRI